MPCKRAKLTGNLEADREAVRQALLKTDMETVFGKVKFGNWTGPLGDPYTNQNIYSPEHSVLAQWRGGELLNVWPKANAEVAVVFPDPSTKTQRRPSGARAPCTRRGRYPDPGMETFVQSMVSGVLTGSLYAMIGIGLTIVFGVMRIINMAHGEMVMLGMFGAFWAHAAWKLDPFLSHPDLGPRCMFVSGRVRLPLPAQEDHRRRRAQHAALHRGALAADRQPGPAPLDRRLPHHQPRLRAHADAAVRDRRPGPARHRLRHGHR